MILNVKLLCKIQKNYHRSKQRNNISIFVSVDTSGSSSIFVYIFKLRSSNILWGTLFDQSNFEVWERKVIFVDCAGMHGKRRVFPFFRRKTSPVSVSSLMRFLNCSSKISIFFLTNFALPEVNNISGFTIQFFRWFDT